MRFLRRFQLANQTVSLRGGEVVPWLESSFSPWVRALNIGWTTLANFPFGNPRFAHLHELEFLWVKFSEFPSEIFQMKQLKTLRFINVEFSEFPKEICEMRQLEQLAVCGAGLTQIPDSLAQLKNLRDVDFGCNKLRNFDVDLHSLRRLKSFAIPDNPLQKLPSALPPNTHLGLASTLFREYIGWQFKDIPQ